MWLLLRSHVRRSWNSTSIHFGAEFIRTRDAETHSTSLEIPIQSWVTKLEPTLEGTKAEAAIPDISAKSTWQSGSSQCVPAPCDACGPSMD